MRVAILGTGLIGGSLGFALKSRNPEMTIAAYDVDERAADAAVSRGAADVRAATPAEACAGCSVVFVATPLSGIVPTLEAVAAAVESDCIVTDVGSTKGRVTVEAERIFSRKSSVTFIGGHPMAGSEQTGIEASRADLFADAWWVLTPTERTDAGAYKKLHRMLSDLGAKVMALEPNRHDQLMAVISHIPQLTATTLMNLAADKGKEHGALLALAAGGFRDVTRIAASNPDLWIEICRENREAIAQELEEFAERLMSLNKRLREGEFDALRTQLATARDARRQLGRKDVPGDMFEVVLEIPDRPGVLAEVTRLVGDLGVNIEDLGISHASEGGHGSLHMAVLGEEQAKSVCSALSTHGYTVKAIQS